MVKKLFMMNSLVDIQQLSREEFKRILNISNIETDPLKPYKELKKYNEAEFNKMMKMHVTDPILKRLGFMDWNEDVFVYMRKLDKESSFSIYFVGAVQYFFAEDLERFIEDVKWCKEAYKNKPEELFKMICYFDDSYWNSMIYDAQRCQAKGERFYKGLDAVEVELYGKMHERSYENDQLEKRESKKRDAEAMFVIF